MAEDEPIDWRVQGAVYACGALNHSMGMMVAVIMPLWLLHLNVSPLMIGVAPVSYTHLTLPTKA